MASTEVWCEGWPDEVGWYDCMDADTGEEHRLRYWKCINDDRRREWIDIYGQYVREKHILWNMYSRKFAG